MTETVAVALSGGVDSLVAAHLLKLQQYDVIGIHFLTGYDRFSGDTSPRLRADAETIVRQRFSPLIDALEIPLYIVDVSDIFARRVVDYFSKTYQQGKTPNPCLVCNPCIKFDRLTAFAREKGANRLATGHYARTLPDETGRYRLFRGRDRRKDQSYFLSFLTQEMLAAAVFPLGHRTKSEVRRLAAENGLSPLYSDESQDVCFIQRGGYADFLARQVDFEIKPGPIEDSSGKRIGRHWGLHRFTVGQRRGINIPAAEPYYVLRIDSKRNRLVVGFRRELATTACEVTGINWIADVPQAPIDVHTQVRYRHRAAASRLEPRRRAAAAIVRFSTPQEGAAPGQGAVFYKGDEVLGGGFIASTDTDTDERRP
jgi:tRNA-specific 2-thiouridylase